MPRLRRSRTEEPGIARVRRGRGVRYIDASGAVVEDAAVLDRIKALGIPPAWTDVWIAPAANDHIQALGFDAAGRRQYIYHVAWRAAQDRQKFDRMLELAEALPRARRTVTADLRARDLGRGRVLAGAFRLLDATGIRSGSDEYERENGSYGLSTLLGAHATVAGKEVVILSFPAKSGKLWHSHVNDRELASLVTALKRRGPHERLLAWKDADAKWHTVRPEDINEDIRSRTGGDFTAKDFRTLRGTAVAAECLARVGTADSVRSRQRAIASAYASAAEALGNTAAIARKSYVDPRVIDRYLHGETMELVRGRSAELALRALLAT